MYNSKISLCYLKSVELSIHENCTKYDLKKRKKELKQGLSLNNMLVLLQVCKWKPYKITRIIKTVVNEKGKVQKEIIITKQL